MNEPPAKKFARKTKFNNDWIKMNKFKNWLCKVDGDNYSAYCKICPKQFAIHSKGINDITSHAEGKKHIQNELIHKKNEVINSYFVTQATHEENIIAAAELSMVYHSVMHHHSYLSIDCNSNLNKIIFNDSNIIKKFSCGRTKANAIVTNVLAPFSIEKHVKYLIENNLKFSISSDASNKGNKKMYPLIIQYFHTESGITNFVLDFYETPEETSESIYKNIKKRLIDNNLKITDIISYGADNASVNYGKHHSVFVNLQYENDLILKANCLCHVIHNCAKHSFMKLPLDIENFVMKIYNHFAVSSKRSNSLKQCYEYTDTEYKKLQKHTPTRWLTLHKALDRIINNLEAIKLYFIGINEIELPNVIHDFIYNKDNLVDELFLVFAYEVTKLFNDSILIFENRNTTSIILYNEMCNLKARLTNRMKHKFYGSDINEKLEKLSKEQIKLFEEEAIKVYNIAIDYLNKWFEYDNSIFEKIASLNPEFELEYKKIVPVVNHFKINIDKTKLFDEVAIVNEAIENFNFVDKKQSHVKIWCKLFKDKNLPNIQKIIETVLCIPVSNAYTERIFSIMKNLITDERNSLEIDTIKSEICVKVNFSVSCIEFANFVKNESRLLSAAKSSRKYKF